MVFSFVFLVAVTSFGDDTFNKLFNAGKYKEAIDYADQKIPPASRDAAMWVKIAEANEKAGLIEKALASYMVSWRMNPQDYASLLGAARIYNKLQQYEEALTMAKKALDIQFTGEASWEYAQACIQLKRTAEAKQALEKVIETDPGNIIANRELGIIYYNDKQYSKAIALLAKSYERNADPNVAYQIGVCYSETGNAGSAIEYLNKALEKNGSLHEARLRLARTYFQRDQFNEAAAEYSKVATKIPFEAQDYFSLGFSLEKTGKNNEAIGAFRSAIGRYGSSKSKEAMTAYYKVGVADLEAKRYSEALSAFKYLEQADPKAVYVKDLYFLLADAYMGARNSSEAMLSLEKAIRLDASNIEAYARLADLYEKNGMQDKAKATYEKMMSLSPNDPKVYLVLGEYNLKARKFSEALDLFIKSSTLQNSAAALEGIALSASAVNQWEKARDAAESAVKLDGSRIKSRIVLADALMRAKSYQEAKVHLEVLVGKEPTNKKYWEDLAECYSNLGEADNLSKADVKILGLDRSNTTSRMRQATYSLGKGDKESAYALFKDLAILKPQDATVFKNLFQIALDKNDKISGVNYLQRYLELNPNDAESQRLLGDMLYDRKDLDGALVAYRKALSIDPAIKGFYKRYAEIVIKKGQQDEVIKALSGVINTGEADFSTYQTLGMIYKGKGIYKKAIEMYQKALTLDPRNSDALTSLGECQASLGDISGAVISFEQAIMMNPGANEEYKTLGDLYMRQKKEDQAVGAYTKYLEKSAQDEAVAKVVGEYYYLRKNYDAATKFLAVVKGKTSLEFPHLFMLCESYYFSGKWDQTITYADMLLERNPKPDAKKDVLRMKAEAYEKTNQMEKALLVYDEYCKIPGVRDGETAYKRAFLREKTNPTLAESIYLQNISIYPTDSRNYLQLGLLYSQKDATLPKAAPMLEKAAATAGKDKSLWLKIAQIYGKLGKEEKELDAYKSYIDTDPQNLEANIRIGTILVKKGKITEGMVYLETANTFSPNNIDVISVLAEGYLKTNRTKEAISLLVKVKEQKPNDPVLRRNLFDAYLKVGDKKSALNEIKDIVEMSRDNELLLKYAYMLIEDGKEKEADDAIENILATNPENIEALMLRAKIQRMRKKFDEAIETYKEVIYIDANYAPALYERAETYMLQNKVQWAEKFYDRALRADPKYGLAEFGKAKLAKLRKDEDAYRTHLRNARDLDPENPEIVAECKKAKIY